MPTRHPVTIDTAAAPDAVATIDGTEPVELLLRDLRATRSGLSQREADRRLVAFGSNVLTRRGGRRWPRELARQFTHPLALLLWAAAGLAFVVSIVAVAIAIIVVIVLNAVFAFVQELQASAPSRRCRSTCRLTPRYGAMAPYEPSTPARSCRATCW
jgi:magnesium-transporting ATPase (P-type)